jgi:hypothetical protein
VSRSVDGKSFSNISATTAAFTLDGGRYGIDCIATYGGGSVALSKLGGDGSTFVTVRDINGNAVSFTANGYVVADLPAGSYRVTIATATGVYMNVRRAPTD